MDRHRAPVMTRDSVCFGVHVDGVCAVGCNRPKVLAALKDVKATLDAAGLQCSEVEADTSKHVFTRLQLDHETGILSLEAPRIWWLRHGLEFAACQKHLAGLSSMLGFVLHVLSDREAGAAFHLQPCQSFLWWSTWGLWSYASLV